MHNCIMIIIYTIHHFMNGWKGIEEEKKGGGGSLNKHQKYHVLFLFLTVVFNI